MARYISRKDLTALPGFSPSQTDGKVDYEKLYSEANWNTSFKCQSSMIRAVQYDTEKLWMRVEFVENDDVCIFENVPVSVYADLLEVSKRNGSVGQAFWKSVRMDKQRNKAQYPFWYENKGAWIYVPQWAKEKYGTKEQARRAINRLDPDSDEAKLYNAETMRYYDERGGVYKATEAAQNAAAKEYLKNLGAEFEEPPTEAEVPDEVQAARAMLSKAQMKAMSDKGNKYSAYHAQRMEELPDRVDEINTGGLRVGNQQAKRHAFGIKSPKDETEVLAYLPSNGKIVYHPDMVRKNPKDGTPILDKKTGKPKGTLTYEINGVPYTWEQVAGRIIPQYQQPPPITADKSIVNIENIGHDERGNVIIGRGAKEEDGSTE